MPSKDSRKIPRKEKNVVIKAVDSEHSLTIDMYDLGYIQFVQDSPVENKVPLHH